jgi:L-iditol 2-dehydrogenase
LQPVPKTGEVLLRVTAVGICGSDIHWYVEGTTGDEGITQPFVLGHEFAGVIESGKMEGARVAVDPQVPCGRCEYCLEGNPNLCPTHYFAGQVPQDGALQEYMAWPKSNVFAIPDSISDEEGAMLEPLGVAIHTVDLGKLRAGMHVGVYGCGPIGLLVIQLARLSGAEAIIATDKLSHRLGAARELGATETLLESGGEESDRILALTKNRGLDVTFEVAGENGAVETAVETCKPGGRVVLCGIPAVNRTSFRASSARRKELTIKLVRRMKHTYPRAIQLVESGSVDVLSLITHRFPLEKYKEAFDISESREGLKVMILP